MASPSNCFNLHLNRLYRLKAKELCRCEGNLVLSPKQSPRCVGGDCFVGKSECPPRNDICLELETNILTPLSLAPSFGFGDRLGLATPGHIAAVSCTRFSPIFAQQSVRENARTG